MDKHVIKIVRATTVPMSLASFCKGMLRELGERYEVVAISSPGRELEELKTYENVRVIAVPMERHISVVKDCKSLIQMWRVFRQETPTMVHSMTPKAGMICMVAAWLARVPLRVHTFTGLVFPTSSGIKRRLLMATDWLTCACSTHVIPEGEGVRNDLIRYGITHKPLKVLGYGNVRGVDMNYYSERDDVKLKMDALGLRDDKNFIFLFVGRIVRDKGINELCKAFERIHQENSQTKLYLVGPYEDSLDPISEEAKKIINSDCSIEAVGAKSDVELLAYYAVADCFVFPSYREGFPNTVLEAGAMGLPSIVTDINGAREIIQDGVNGMIVPPQNVEALYKAMKRADKDRNKLREMASRSRRLVGERFEQSYVRKCLYDFYDEILMPYK